MERGQQAQSWELRPRCPAVPRCRGCRAALLGRGPSLSNATQSLLQHVTREPPAVRRVSFRRRRRHPWPTGRPQGRDRNPGPGQPSARTGLLLPHVSLCHARRLTLHQRGLLSLLPIACQSSPCSRDHRCGWGGRSWKHPEAPRDREQGRRSGAEAAGGAEGTATPPPAVGPACSLLTRQSKAACLCPGPAAPPTAGADQEPGDDLLPR